MSVKELFSIIAIILTLVAYYPYIRSIHLGQTRPHFFSWLIWGLTTIIVFLAQVSAGGGVGVWPVLLSGIITFYISLQGFLKRAEIRISALDYLFLIAALLAIPLWLLSNNPLWAVIIVTTIDLCGFGPTLRKAVENPEQENIWFYLIFFIRCGFVLLALEAYSLVTVLFPLTVGICCLIMLVLLFTAGQQLRSSKP
ncbi:MAG: hypothetical protein CMQ38_01865 [Gammaproteobacteria bacterium]|nr:hypothetical protein [Gammaproteobacteria bacterium]|tara:strand:- start:1324 stop:1914 length:591 start_codon:yes stop_codon:yes gene_type:complete